MSRPQFNRTESNVEDWLESHYEYVSPDYLNEDKGTKSYPFTPRDPVRDHTPEPSDNSSSRSKGHRRHRAHQDSHHHRPMTPPSEDRLERERVRDRERHRPHRTSRSLSGNRGHDSEKGEEAARERRPRGHKPAADEPQTQTRYPPRADRGRPKRPVLNTANTTPNFSRAMEDKDHEEAHHQAHHRQRRYSHSSSPPRHRERPSKTHQHHHHQRHVVDDDNGGGGGGGDNHSDDQRRRHRDARSYSSRDTHSSSHAPPSTASTTKARRPSLSHSKTVPPHTASSTTTTTNKSGRRSSFSFLSDPRFTAAATAALQAGATAAVGAMGSPNAGTKVARAALGAAALGALKSPSGASAPQAAGSYVGEKAARRRR